MKYKIQPAKPAIDYPIISEMWSAWMGYPLSVEDLHEEDRIIINGRIRQWLVARSPEQGVVGIAYVIRKPSQPNGRFHGNVVVKQAWQNQGIGHALCNHVEQYMKTHGATEWYGRVKEESILGQKFVENRGFDKAYHVFDSALDLKTFAEAQFEGLIEQVEATGIRFITFDTVSQDPVAQRKLYEINKLAGLNEPATDGFSTFDTWQKIVLTAPWFHPDCEYVALDGERYVGLSGAFPTDDPLIFTTGFTGIDPEYQGRKIAQALKLLTIRQVISRGGAEIRTENDSRNVAMLAINRKLGYKPFSGHFGVVKQLV